jgi:hypothetical protein
MCSRHLPRSQPQTCLQAIQYVKPSRRLPKTALLTRPRSCPYLASFILRQPAACTLRRCRGVWGLPNFTAHAISSRGCIGMGATASSYLPPSERRLAIREIRHLAFLRRASAGHRRNACSVEPKQWRNHAASARRIVRHPRVAPFLVRLLPLLSLIQLPRPRPAPPLLMPAVALFIT